MTFAQFLFEIRQRAASLSADGKRPEAIERIAREILDGIHESDHLAQVKRILAAFLGLGEGEEFDAALLDELTPETVMRLDMIAVELRDFGRTREAIRALRGALIRPVH